MIKILLEFHLKSIGDCGENFLIRNHFQEVPEPPKEEHTRKIRRKNIDTSIKDKPASPLQQIDEQLTLVELMKNKKQINSRQEVKQKIGAMLPVKKR